MRFHLSVIPLVAALLFIGGCETLREWQCEPRECLFQEIKLNQARSLAYWEPLMRESIDRRLGVIPDELLKYVDLDNRIYGYDERPAKFHDSHTIALLRQAYFSLPPVVHRLVEPKLAGIYLVDGLGSSGYTESIQDQQGRPVAGVIVLDAALFKRKANDWASWRDSTAFGDNASLEIRTTIASEENNNLMTAIQFLMVHELAHVYSIGSDVHPHWTADLNWVELSDYPFTAMSWNISPAGRYQSLFDAAFWQRSKLRYYQEPGLGARELEPTLVNLSRTNFPSLYASTRPEEDFAEAFAIYVMSEMKGNPYYIEVIKNGKTAARVESCFVARCPRKREFMQNLLGQ
ncbi:MAG: hypothetical protein AAF353_20655 [Pseudomonadota bacterium]